jgi:glutathione S-transferase
MSRILYDLAKADETLRFSPYCWRAKLALAHKNLNYDTVPCHFTDKDTISFSGQDKLPILVDRGTVIADSQAIAEYLDEAYPNEPPLFGDQPAQALTTFVKSWAETRLHPAIAMVILPDIHGRLAEQDKDYFRRTREAKFGRTIEDIAAARGEAEETFHAILAPLLSSLAKQPFLAGDAPNYADHIAFGALQWARLMSSTPLLESEPAIISWMDSVLETYGLQ